MGAGGSGQSRPSAEPGPRIHEQKNSKFRTDDSIREINGSFNSLTYACIRLGTSR